MTPKRIGILGGSYNPVHIGHLIIADYICQHAGLDEVWLMLSPQNPLKSPDGLAGDSDRLEMLRIATADTPRLTVSTVEFDLPRPSYTATTLRTLSQRHPDCEFSLIIGTDNWNIFDRWRDSEYILDNHHLYIYPRPGEQATRPLDNRATLIDAPMIDISSTFIRQQISAGFDISLFLPAGVYDYITAHHLYRQPT